jgi:hypothetical protein
MLMFATTEDGTVEFHLQAVLGCSPLNSQIAIEVNGDSNPVAINLAPGSTDNLVPATSYLPLTLPAGSHTAQVMLRGIALGQPTSCGTGLDVPATIQANVDVPLRFGVSFTGAALPASAAILKVDGLLKTDGNVLLIGAALQPVPGTEFTFMVDNPGKAFFAVDTNFAKPAGAPDSASIGVKVGLRIDGTDFDLAFQEETGELGADVENLHIAASKPFDLAIGSHTVQLLYTSTPMVVGRDMELEANATRGASVSVIHP